MAGRFSDEDIALTLNRVGIRTARGLTWNAGRVRAYRSYHKLRALDRSDDKPLEFLARLLTHILRWAVLRSSPATSDSFEAARMRTIPEPNEHLVHFHGAYANRIRHNYREPIRTEDEAIVIRTILDHRDKIDAEPRAPPDVSSN